MSPARIKGGPLAAGVATLAILGLTAVPDLSPTTPGPELAPVARAEGVSGAIVSDVRQAHLAGRPAPAIIVGDRRFDLEPGARLVELPDGSAVLAGRLMPPGLASPDTGFTLELEFKPYGASPMGEQVPAPPRLATNPLDDDVVVTRAYDGDDPSVPRFGGLTGQLVGIGEAAGLILDIRPLGEIPVGAQPMDLVEGEGPAMVLVGRFTWMTAPESSRSSYALPDDGFGSLAIAVQRGIVGDPE